jgi:hypothetical protein
VLLRQKKNQARAIRNGPDSDLANNLVSNYLSVANRS